MNISQPSEGASDDIWMLYNSHSFVVSRFFFFFFFFSVPLSLIYRSLILVVAAFDDWLHCYAYILNGLFKSKFSIQNFFTVTFGGHFTQSPWQSFPLLAIKIVPLNTIDLWIMGIKWGFAKGIYSHLYYHTIYHSLSHLSNGIFYPLPILFNNMLTIKLIITYN